MDSSKNARTDSRISSAPKAVQDENERRLFHLKTLYDVSHELLGVVEIRIILKNFLLMTLGNFGVVEGILLTRDFHSAEASQLVTIGIEEDDKESIRKGIANFMIADNPGYAILSEEERQRLKFLPQSVECVACFSVDEGCAGLLGLGSKITNIPYSNEDGDLVETLVNNLVVSLKNARSAEALKAAYEELAVLNRAKDKLIDHMSHELRTPLAVLKASLALLQKKLAVLPEEQWQRSLMRAERHLQRLMDIQEEVDDILKNPVARSYHTLTGLIDQCADELEVLIAEQTGDSAVVECVRQRIDEIFGPREAVAEDIALDEFLKDTMKRIQPLFAQRHLELTIDTDRAAVVSIPSEPLEKLITGLIRNAVENTPDEGKIEVQVKKSNSVVMLSVHDFGVGIVDEHRRHIFEGFFPTHDTNLYSSKHPYEFNAGGKGADLLRLKIFSERFNFYLDVSSVRCGYIPLVTDLCPGRISQCEFCKTVEDCHRSGKTTFSAVFQYP